MSYICTDFNLFLHLIYERILTFCTVPFSIAGLALYKSYIIIIIIITCSFGL